MVVFAQVPRSLHHALITLITAHRSGKEQSCSTMERNRSKKAKAFGASRGKSVKIIKSDPETHLVRKGSSQVPDRNFVRTVVEVRRFQQFTAVTNQGFTLANGHDQFLVVTNVAGNAVPYIDSWRIKSIDIYAIAGSDGSQTSVVFTPTGASTDNMNNDPEQLFNLTARSFTEPSHMRIVASSKRPLGAWHFTSNTGFASTLFQINIATNTSATGLRVTMDITFETRKNLAGLPLGYGAVTGTTVLGAMGGRNILSGMQLMAVNNLG